MYLLCEFMSECSHPLGVFLNGVILELSGYILDKIESLKLFFVQFLFMFEHSMQIACLFLADIGLQISPLQIVHMDKFLGDLAKFYLAAT